MGHAVSHADDANGLSLGSEETYPSFRCRTCWARAWRAAVIIAQDPSTPLGTGSERRNPGRRERRSQNWLQPAAHVPQVRPSFGLTWAAKIRSGRVIFSLLITRPTFHPWIRSCQVSQVIVQKKDANLGHNLMRHARPCRDSDSIPLATQDCAFGLSWAELRCPARRDGTYAEKESSGCECNGDFRQRLTKSNSVRCDIVCSWNDRARRAASPLAQDGAKRNPG